LIIKHFLLADVRAGLLGGLLLYLLCASAQAQSQRILVLGDSISAAYGMSLEQGWVSLLEQRLAGDSQAVQVINASISGETTAGGLRRLPGLLQKYQPTVVIIELGANDGLRGFPLAELEANLAQLAELSAAAGARVILVPMEIPPNYGARYTAGFRQTFVDVAERQGCALAPFLLDGVATDPDLMQADGLHPSAAAQPKLLATILPTVQAALEAR